MFYGMPGIGKTELGSLFPKSLILGFEMGTNALDNIYVQPIQSWNDFKTCVSQLTRNQKLKEKYETIVIDTADSAWEACVKYICSNNGVEDLSEIDWGKGYNFSGKQYYTCLRDLAFSGYGIVFISHATEKKVKNEKGEEENKITYSLQPRPFDIINKMVDVIGYIRTVKVGDTFKRVISFRSEDNSFTCKSRFKYIKPTVDFSYENIVDAIYEAIDKSTEINNTESTEEENAYCKPNFDELMQEAKILWGKAVQASKVDEVRNVLKQIFQKDISFSQIEESEVDNLFKAILEIREMF